MTAFEDSNRQRSRDRHTFTVETSGTEAYDRIREALRGVRLDGDSIVRARVEIDTISDVSHTTQLTIDDLHNRENGEEQSRQEQIDCKSTKDAEGGNDEAIESDSEPHRDENNPDQKELNEIVIQDRCLEPGDVITIKTNENGWYNTSQRITRIEKVDVIRGQHDQTRVTHRVYLTKATSNAKERPWIERHDNGKFYYRTSSRNQPTLLKGIRGGVSVEDTNHRSEGIS